MVIGQPSTGRTLFTTRAANCSNPSSVMEFCQEFCDSDTPFEAAVCATALPIVTARGLQTQGNDRLDAVACTCNSTLPAFTTTTPSSSCLRNTTYVECSRTCAAKGQHVGEWSCVDDALRQRVRIMPYNHFIDHDMDFLQSIRQQFTACTCINENAPTLPDPFCVDEYNKAVKQFDNDSTLLSKCFFKQPGIIESFNNFSFNFSSGSTSSSQGSYPNSTSLSSPKNNASTPGTLLALEMAAMMILGAIMVVL